jgi:hypothetical protein
MFPSSAGFAPVHQRGGGYEDIVFLSTIGDVLDATQSGPVGDQRVARLYMLT